MAKRLGETVSIQMDGLDSDGNLMSTLRVEWYGMENAEANQMQRDVVGGLTALAEKWDSLKQDPSTSFGSGKKG